MWILPKQLISDFVPATEGLSLDCDEQSQLCAQSLFVRSKHSPARTWLQKWKRDSWTKHLYGRILKPSLGKAFEIAWTSSLEAIPANHSAQQESEQERMTLDIYGPSSQAEFDFFGQESASLKTSKDISLWGCPTSSKTWQDWVTERRGAYSQRVKSARLTNGSGSLSWPTASARDWKGCYSEHAMIRKDGKMRGDLLPDAVRLAGSGLSLPTNAKGIQRKDASVLNVATITQSANAQVPHKTDTNTSNFKESSTQELWPTPTVQESGKIGNQANHGQKALSNHPAIVGLPTREKGIKSGHLAPASNSSHGSRPGLWGTPTARDYKSGRGNEERQYKELTPMVERQQNGKLNPRWVETLMGLPIGWTMPSCSSLVTIERTNCDFSETELSQQQQSELFDC